MLTVLRCVVSTFLVFAKSRGQIAAEALVLRHQLAVLQLERKTRRQTQCDSVAGLGLGKRIALNRSTTVEARVRPLDSPPAPPDSSTASPHCITTITARSDRPSDHPPRSKRARFAVDPIIQRHRQHYSDCVLDYRHG